MTERTAKEQRIATREIAEVWLSDHVGRLAGMFFGVVALVLLIILAALGWTPALTGLVVLVFGVLLIAVGGRMRGGRR